jgi:SAM-dependent methyltransferase
VAYVGYESWASYSDAYRSRLHRWEDGDCRARLLACLAQAPSREVLDLGCGDGLALTLMGFGVDSYVGVDLSSALLDKLALRHPMAETVQADAMDYLAGLTPAPDRTFGAIVSTFGSVSYMLDPLRLLTLVRERLRPRGRVLLCWFAPAWSSKEALPIRAGMTLPYLTPAPALLEAWATRAGLTDVVVTPAVVTEFPFVAPVAQALSEATGLWSSRAKYLYLSARRGPCRE